MTVVHEFDPTGRELRANFYLSGLDYEDLEEHLELTPHQIRASLFVGPHSDPIDVWLLRDWLLQVLSDQGKEPVEFTVLTDQARLVASQYIVLKDVPPSPDFDEYEAGDSEVGGDEDGLLEGEVL